MSFFECDKYLSKAILSSVPQKTEWSLNGLKLMYLIACMVSDHRIFLEKNKAIDFSHKDIKKHLETVPKSYEINRDQFIELTGISESHAAREIKKACEDILLKLMKTPNPFDIKNEKSFEIFQWFSKATYNDKKGKIEVSIHPDSLPYFVVLVTYTKLNYNYIGKLKNIYSVRIYLICKAAQARIKSNLELEFNIDEFKSKLGLSGKYNNIPLLRTRVLNVAEKEINRETDIIFTYKLSKEGKKFTNILINISTKTSNENKTKSQSIKKAEVFNNLRKNILEKDLVSQLFEKYGKKACEASIKKLEFEIKKGKQIKNTTGYLIKCIENYNKEAEKNKHSFQQSSAANNINQSTDNDIVSNDHKERQTALQASVLAEEKNTSSLNKNKNDTLVNHTEIDECDNREYLSEEEKPPIRDEKTEAAINDLSNLGVHYKQAVKYVENYGVQTVNHAVKKTIEASKRASNEGKTIDNVAAYVVKCLHNSYETLQLSSDDINAQANAEKEAKQKAFLDRELRWVELDKWCTKHQEYIIPIIQKHIAAEAVTDYQEYLFLKNCITKVSAYMDIQDYSLLFTDVFLEVNNRKLCFNLKSFYNLLTEMMER